VQTLPPTATVTASPTVTLTLTPPLGAAAYVSYGRGSLRLREAPNENAAVLTNLNELTPLSLLQRTADGVWYQVALADGRQGWVMAQFVTLNVPLDGVAIAATPTANAANANHCISVVGDSIAYGHVLYQIPGYGYALA